MRRARFSLTRCLARCFWWVAAAALFAVRPHLAAMILDLPRIRGRASGACHGPPGCPKFTGTIDEEGRIRIDCENYPEHWQEIQLPEEWVLAYQAHQEDLSDRPPSPETLQNKVEVHADQAWTVDEADPGYVELRGQLTADNIGRANACGESMYDAVQCMLFDAVDLSMRLSSSPHT